MSKDVFGTAVWLRAKTGARVMVRLGPQAYWDQGRIRVAKRDATFEPWRCPTCDGTRIWWSLSHAPVCARCAPVSSEIMERAWHDALAFCTGLIQTNGVEDPATKAAIMGTLDEAILSGDLTRLLRLGVIHHMMQVANNGKE